MIKDDIATIKSCIESFDRVECGDFYEDCIFKDNGLDGDIDILLSSDTGNDLRMILPDVTCIIQNEFNHLYLFSISDIRKNLSFSARAEFGSNSPENDDLVYFGYIPFMKTMGAQTICINSKNKDEILLAEVGFFSDATGEEFMKARLPTVAAY